MAGSTTSQRLQVTTSGNTTVNPDAAVSVDSEGKLQSVTPPGDATSAGMPKHYVYSYDPMGRLTAMTENNCQTPDQTGTLNYWALRCSQGHEYLAASREDVCKECGRAPLGEADPLMFPRFGYTTAAWDPPKPPGRQLDRVGEILGLLVSVLVPLFIR